MPLSLFATRARLLRTSLYLTVVLACMVVAPLVSAQSDQIIPLSQIHTGMKGYAYTIFAGDNADKFDLQVIGVMPNFLGPGQAIILVQLLGDKAEHSGVAAGMSGSPVYIGGKLAGALSLKLGIFTKEPIAGVTPIEDVLHPPSSGATLSGAAAASLPLPLNAAPRATLSAGATLAPIGTPLVFSGFRSDAIQQFAPQLAGYGMVATQGGSVPAQKDDAELKSGDMAGMVLVSGDASINSACTVTAVRADQVYLCGHPFLSLGDVALPMARSRVVMTLASNMSSTKIVNVGGPIGTITGDHLTAVTGKLGPAPPMIPLDLTLAVNGAEKNLHFDLVNHSKLTPLLVALTTYNGLTENALYGEGNTLHVQGEVQLKGHSPLRLESSYAPTDSLNPDSLPVAIGMQAVFARLFANTFEQPNVEGIKIRINSLPGRASYTVESAWLEKGDAVPGEEIGVRVLLRPYRGASRLEQLKIRVPEQVPRGATLRMLVSDAEWLNRVSRGLAGSGSGDAGLEQLVSQMNEERRNDRVYVGLFMPAPTLLWSGKEMPNVPLSQITVLDGRPAPGSMQVLRESLASEDSVALGGPVAGVISLNLSVR